MKTFDFKDDLVKVCHRNASGQSKILFVDSDNCEQFEVVGDIKYDKENDTNIVQLRVIE